MSAVTWTWCDDDYKPATATTPPENQVRVLALAASGIEGRAEQDILDLLGSDLMPRDVDTLRELHIT